MYATFETSSKDIQNKGYDSVIKIDSSIQSLSWMSKTSIFPNSAVSASSTTAAAAAAAAAVTASQNTITDLNNNTANTSNNNNSNANPSNASAQQPAASRATAATRSPNDDEIKFDRFSHYQVSKLI
jgi:hypothetical protein